jgi:hypothetical protein
MNAYVLIGLALTLPSQSPTSRTKAWRQLKGCGAAVLRDGVYVLPSAPRHEALLLEIGREIEAAGGTAELLQLQARDDVQERRFQALFERQAELAALLDDLRALSATPALGLPQQERQLRKLRRQFEQIQAIDFFPGEAQAQARHALEQAEARLAAQLSPDEPQAAQGTLALLQRADYQRRTWATRARPRIDRLASAWLIRRHIDPGAHFLWLAAPKDCPPTALGFDFDGAAFTHMGGRVTFETLLASFGLENDPALTRLGSVVHYLDVGGIPAPEAAGLAAILEGLRQQESDDDRLLAAALPIFDALVRHFSDSP